MSDVYRWPYATFTLYRHVGTDEDGDRRITHVDYTVNDPENSGLVLLPDEFAEALEDDGIEKVRHIGMADAADDEEPDEDGMLPPLIAGEPTGWLVRLDNLIEVLSETLSLPFNRIET